MKIRRTHVFILVGTATLILISLVSAFAAAITVPSTRLMDRSFVPDANDLKPPECAGLNLINIVTGSGVINGTQDNDLILGDVGDDKLQGKNGDDCLVGGDGDDNLTGNNGWDVCIGGAGNDTFKQCEVEWQ
jgi:Ca2+-binding RTX toxin-like protein